MGHPVRSSLQRSWLGNAISRPRTEMASVLSHPDQGKSRRDQGGGEATMDGVSIVTTEQNDQFDRCSQATREWFDDTHTFPSPAAARLVNQRGQCNDR